MTEVAPDNRRVMCATCGTALGETAISQLEGAGRNHRTAEARELLERWANARSVDPYGPPKQRVLEKALAEEVPTVPPAVQPATAVASASSPSEKRAMAPANDELDRLTREILTRVDEMTRSPAAEPTSRIESRQSSLVTAENRSVDSVVAGTRVDPPDNEHDHGGTTRSLTMPGNGAHRFQPQNEPLANDASNLTAATRAEQIPAARPQIAIARPEPEPPSEGAEPICVPARKNLTLLGNFGQGMAYVGILGITAGLSVVVLGYFGGPAHYAPTGWLIATIGQMLLLLGIVTLVSVGIEQTSAEMRATVEERVNAIVQRIECLGQNVRIDAEAQQPQPPRPHWTEASAGQQLPAGTNRAQA